MSFSDPQRISISAAAGIAVVALLLLGWVSALPGGAHYSDVVMYLDAAQRIGAGQTPHVDFFLPFGALSAELFALVKSVFPQTQPVLGAQYAILLIALPAMLAATWRARSKTHTAWLWMGFALFALLPANLSTFPAPELVAGVDGEGIYNRHAGLMLYALAAALIHNEDRILSGVLSGLVFVAIGFIQTSALIVAGPMILFGLIAARLDWRAMVIVIAAGFTLVLGIEWSTKLVSAYVDDLSLFTPPPAEGGLVEQVWNAALSAFMANFMGAVLMGAAGFALAWRAWTTPDKPDERIWLVNAGFGLLLVLAAALVGESHMNGTQALAFLTPIALKIAADHWDAQGPSRAASLCALIFLGLTGGGAIYTGARLVKAAFEAEAVGAPGLGLSASAEDIAAAQAWLDLQIKGPWTARETLLFEAIEALDVQRPLTAPAYALQVGQMLDGVQAWRAASRLQEPHIAVLDRVDPASALSELEPIPGLPVIYDPSQFDFTERSAGIVEALSQSDAILAPLCGPRVASADYAKLVAGALVGRVRTRLSGCWLLFEGRPAPAHEERAAPAR
jgi:hypothetical protein